MQAAIEYLWTETCTPVHSASGNSAPEDRASRSLSGTETGALVSLFPVSESYRSFTVELSLCPLSSALCTAYYRCRHAACRRILRDRHSTLEGNRQRRKFPCEWSNSLNRTRSSSARQDAYRTLVRDKLDPAFVEALRTPPTAAGRWAESASQGDRQSGRPAHRPAARRTRTCFCHQGQAATQPAMICLASGTACFNSDPILFLVLAGFYFRLQHL
jgi:hypothetical protein